MSKNNGILSYSGSSSRRDLFKKDIKGAKTKGDERKAELRNLIPGKLELKGSNKNKKKYMKGEKVDVYFKNLEEYDYFCKYITVNHYQGHNTYDTELLIQLLKRFVKRNSKGELLIRKVGPEKKWVKLKKKKK